MAPNQRTHPRLPATALRHLLANRRRILLAALAAGAVLHRRARRSWSLLLPSGTAEPVPHREVSPLLAANVVCRLGGLKRHRRFYWLRKPESVPTPPSAPPSAPPSGDDRRRPSDTEPPREGH